MFEIRKNSTLKKGTVLLSSYCIFFLLFSSCDKKEAISFKESTVLKINNIPVSKAEYKIFLDEEKAMTFNYFYQKYKIENSKTFWTSVYNNESPIAYIKEKANQHLIKVKTIQDYAVKHNIVKPFDFNNFLNDWQKENKKRKLKKEAGEIVYGPINTSMKDYYFYIQTNLEIRLKDKLDQTVFTPSKNELETYFNRIKKQHFSYLDTISIAYLSFPYKTSTQREQSLKMAVKAYKNALEKKSIKNLSRKAKYQQKEFYDHVPIYGEENPDSMLKKFASNLKEGEIKLFDPKNQLNSSIYIIKLLKPNKKSFREFKDVDKEVIYYYREDKYQKLMDSLYKNSAVKVNKPIYEAITVD